MTSPPGPGGPASGVAVDASRHERLLVSECRGRRIQLLALQTGEPLQFITLPPDGPNNKSASLRSVCVAAEDINLENAPPDEGRAYAVDFANHRVAILKLSA